MKYKIREAKEVENPKPEPEIELYLNRQRDGSVDLMGRDAKGLVWFIIALKTDGTFRRSAFINPTLGLQVDSNGRIIEHSSSKDK